MKPKFFRKWKVISSFLLVYDAIAVNIAYFAALWIRFDCRFSSIDHVYFERFVLFAPIYTLFCITVFFIFKLYHSIWKFVSYTELMQAFYANVVTFIFQLIGITAILGRMPVTYYVLGAVIQFCIVIGVRFFYRFAILERNRRNTALEHARFRAMLIGAGAAGQMILRDVNAASETNDHIFCIIDDNPNKWKRYIDGVPVVGGRDDIMENVEKYNIQKIFVAIPTLSAEDRREILNICKETGCELKNLPGMYQFVTGEITARNLTDVSVEDLLGREPIKVNLEEIFDHITGKTILITGGGGSIGSELARQVASHHPKQLIIFDVYENNAYEIQQELKKKYAWLDLVVLIGSVRDSRRLDQVFEKYRPEIVYHAAAHKHVPLMEDSPCESIKNNAIGTYKTAYAAMVYGCKRFVLISTDKAVNPTNIMGASKRLCEMVIQTFDYMIKCGTPERLPKLFVHETCGDDEVLGYERRELDAKDCVTEFVAVRFGNVLGSNGSVIPLFKKQIEAGGPVTVTHPDIIRYFMTIPEAVSLVLQAGVYAKGGEIFVLDMGEPMKIDTLARNLIKLSGYKPGVDIKIEYTGLRPGEKLYEEKLMAEEGMGKTDNDLIHIGRPLEFEHGKFIDNLNNLMRVAYGNEEDTIRQAVSDIVKTYHFKKN